MTTVTASLKATVAVTASPMAKVLSKPALLNAKESTVGLARTVVVLTLWSGSAASSVWVKGTV